MKQTNKTLVLAIFINLLKFKVLLLNKQVDELHRGKEAFHLTSYKNIKVSTQLAILEGRIL